MHAYGLQKYNQIFLHININVNARELHKNVINLDLHINAREIQVKLEFLIVHDTLILLANTGKNQNFTFLPGTHDWTTFEPKNQKKTSKKSDDETMVDFQQQSPQRFVDRYEHMNSRNDRLMMRLKAIEAEYYSIEN